MARSKSAAKKRKVKVEPEGRAFVQATFNNIIVTLTNKSGQVISWASAGKAGFRGSKKNTPYAAQVAAADAAVSAALCAAVRILTAFGMSTSCPSAKSDDALAVPVADALIFKNSFFITLKNIKFNKKTSYCYNLAKHDG